MCFAVPCEPYVVNPIVARALDILILHADHEQNASTSTCALPAPRAPTRLPASPPASPACGVRLTARPRAALKMLEQIGTVDRVPEYVKKAKDKNSEFRLMGFGHRVYKNYDPRAKVMAGDVPRGAGFHGDQGPEHPQGGDGARSASPCRTITSSKRSSTPTSTSTRGITLRAMGFPLSMFTVLFAVARTVGWVAQWKEMIEDPEQKIGRPRQLYIGATDRSYTAIERRG